MQGEEGEMDAEAAQQLQTDNNKENTAIGGPLASLLLAPALGNSQTDLPLPTYVDLG